MKRFGLSLLILCACCAGSSAQTRSNDEIGEVYASDAAVRGNMILASGGTRVLSGSQVTAGLTTARLQLARGGYVRICPNTNVTISGWRKRELLLGMNSGAVELHFRDGEQFNDALVTPDFRIQLAGPADFHLAVQVDAAGNTCLRSLPQNTGTAVILESMGTGSYKLEAGASVLFSRGRLAEMSEPTSACGCPEPEHPVQVAETAPDPPEGVAEPMPAPQPTAAHVVMEAPFVYNGAAVDPELFQKAAKLSVREDDPFYRSMLPKVTPPAKTSGGGFFRRIGRAFKRIFAS